MAIGEIDIFDLLRDLAVESDDDFFVHERRLLSIARTLDEGWQGDGAVDAAEALIYAAQVFLDRHRLRSPALRAAVECARTEPPARYGQPFICPECGGEDMGGKTSITPSLSPRAPRRLAHPWHGVLSYLHCASCGWPTPAHLAERWGGETPEEAAAEWRARYRGTASRYCSDRAFRRDS